MTDQIRALQYLKGLTLLYVEDDSETRSQYRRYLSRKCGTLVTAGNGQEGIDAFRRCNPALVVTDIRMPEMDGLTMASAIHDVDPAVPVIVLTAFAEDELAKSSSRPGIARFLTKPIAEQELLDALAACGQRLLLAGAATRSKPKVQQLPEKGQCHGCFAGRLAVNDTRPATAATCASLPPPGVKAPSPPLQSDNGAIVSHHGGTVLPISPERHCHHLIRATDVAMLILDDTHVLDCNEAAMALLGVTNFAELLGKSWEELCPPLQMKGMASSQALTSVLGRAASEGAQSFEWLCQRRDDSTPFPARVQLAPLGPADHRLWAVTFHDLSLLRRMEGKVTTLGAQLQEAEKKAAIGLLAGGVAHEYHNMLTVIKGFTSLALKEASPGTKQREYLQQVLQAAQNSIHITSQLLGFSRQSDFSPVALCLDDILEHGLAKMLRHVLGSDIALTRSPGSAPWLVLVEPTHINQMVLNLCLNARDALNGAGAIAIRTGKVAAGEERHRQLSSRGGDWVVLEVEDNGSGMPPEVRTKIFTPFFTTKREGHGTGLGLATVKRLVELNGGIVDVASRPGEGTTFALYFPRLLDQPPARQRKAGRNRSN